MKTSFNFKNIIKDIFYYSGVTNLLIKFSPWHRQHSLFIFTYHRIFPDAKDNKYLGLQHEVFERHIRFIKRNFKIVSLADGLEALYSNDSKGVYAAINFDDGYMDNYLYAYPVLKKYGIPATIFLTTDFIGKDHVFWWDRIFNMVSLLGAEDSKKTANDINRALRTKGEEELQYLVEKLEKKFSLKRAEENPMLGWGEIKEMSKSGIDFGSHTKTHRNLCVLKDEDVIKELTESKRVIEKRIGQEVSILAYPFGIFDKRIKGLAEKSGFKYARSTLRGFNCRDTDRFSLVAISAESLIKTSFLAARISFCPQFTYA